MEKEKINSKYTIIAIVVIIILIVATVGLTVAALYHTLHGSKNNIVSTQGRSFVFSESNTAISLTNAIPVQDSNATSSNANVGVHTFRVTNNNTSGSIQYTITMISYTSGACSGKTLINGSKIKYKVTNTTNSSSPVNSIGIQTNPVSNMSITETVAAGASTTYQLLAWINWDATASDLYVNGNYSNGAKAYCGKLQVTWGDA